MSEHTPGPWTALPQCPASDWVDIVAVIDGRASLPFAACKHFNEVANGRLIAAAPDMLAALHDALAFVADQEDVVDGADGQPVANRAMTLAQTLRAAIAKAEGGAHG